MRQIYYMDKEYVQDIPNSTSTPTANVISKFDSTAKMNSTDMTDSQIDAFMDDIPYAPMVVKDSVPIGAIQAFGGATAPKNWLICDGSLVSRTDYAKLFSVIGTTYGQGDGSTTFNLPDLAGKVAVGSGTNYTLGTSGGEATHTLTEDEMPSHTHNTQNLVNVSGTTISAMTAAGGTYGFGYGATNMLGSTGQNQPHNNMQPYVVTNYIIKYDDKEITGGQLQSIFAIQETQTLTGIGKSWYFHRIGNIVWLSAPNDSSGVVAGLNSIGTLNESMRPMINQYISPGNADVGSTGFLIIGHDGTVSYYAWQAAAGGRNCGFSTSYLTNG